MPIENKPILEKIWIIYYFLIAIYVLILPMIDLGEAAGRAIDVAIIIMIAIYLYYPFIVLQLQRNLYVNKINNLILISICTVPFMLFMLSYIADVARLEVEPLNWLAIPMVICVFTSQVFSTIFIVKHKNKNVAYAIGLFIMFFLSFVFAYFIIREARRDS